ncbi:sigma-54 interaction domain-containing protein [Pseudalkalibacillus salsuginis]|uniref:sigma-54 interaction domain-containing protein n=1 Tax=Pseudalkalibacillus salsuginis TaxID=2910972 RepID=UPI001F273579|nr:sigma 54-interacting transcriptional regulator [Pseudalkalibacillus salsuginis]MCF6411197.1 sigma 54-interacting transcriptional regulator [Pseudalkalibacillus salsuginis]
MLQADFKFKDKRILEAIIDNAFEWVVVVDTEGIVRFMNKNYCDFLEVNSERVIGKHVTEVIENTRMHIVAKTGKAEIADLQYIKGSYMIANRIPIFHEKEVVAALGTVIFRDTEQWKKMNSHVKSLFSELEFYRKEWTANNGAKYTLNDLVGVSDPIKDLKNQVKKISSGDISILIRGESGTGKELLAHSIHQLSERSMAPFVKVNCAAIPDNLLESELFGYVEGAFTGAKKGGKVGKFILANDGTLFLDEIGDMPMKMQAKLLRVLQEKEIEPIGANETEKVNVRVIAATNRPLEKMVQEKLFREDLFYRINGFQLQIPSLRERKEDIKPLVEHFLEKVTRRTGKRIKNMDEEVSRVLFYHKWPGNIRELENVIEAAVHLAYGETITKDSLPEYLKENDRLNIGSKSLKELVEQTEINAIKEALQQNDGDKLAAAKTLGIGKSSFYEKMKKYKLI